MSTIQISLPKIESLDGLYHILCESTKFAISSFSVVKVITTTVGFFTGLKGAALYTYTLALLGGPLGMFGGTVVLGGMSYFAYKCLNKLIKKLFKN